MRKLLAAGKDPRQVALEEKLAARLEAAVTFRIVADEWLAKCEREGRAEITMYKKRWLLDFAHPKLGDRPVNRISAHELYEMLRGVSAVISEIDGVTRQNACMIEESNRSMLDLSAETRHLTQLVSRFRTDREPFPRLVSNAA